MTLLDFIYSYTPPSLEFILNPTHPGYMIVAVVEIQFVLFTLAEYEISKTYKKKLPVSILGVWICNLPRRCKANQGQGSQSYRVQCENTGTVGKYFSYLYVYKHNCDNNAIDIV